jgi:hypothetical protein
MSRHIITHRISEFTKKFGFIYGFKNTSNVDNFLIDSNTKSEKSSTND